MSLIKKIFLPFLLFFIFSEAHAVTTTPDTLVDTSFGTDGGGTVSIDVADTTSGQINDIAITDDYIVVVGEGVNSYSQPFCYIVLLDKSGNQLSTVKRDANWSNLNYTCSSVVVSGTTAYIIGEYNNTYSTAYRSAVWQYSLEGGVLTYQDYGYGTSDTDEIQVNTGIVVGDYLYVAGSHNDDFYLEQWTLSGLTFSTSFEYDIYSSSDDDTVRKLLKSADETSLYLVGPADENSTYAAIKLAISGSSVTQDTTYGNYSDLYLRNYSSSWGYQDLGGSNYMYNAYLDGETIITTGKVTTSDGINKVFMERVASDGTGMDSSGYVEVTDGAGRSIIPSGDYVYVGGYIQNDSMDFAILRYSSDEIDTTFGSSGIITTDFYSDDDYAYTMAMDDDKIYLAGYQTNESGVAQYTISRYNTTQTTEEGEGEGEGDETCTATASTESSCYDYTDNECDGLVDCDDDECATSIFCTGTTTETNCTDYLDDESDGYTDCDDSDCVFDDACVLPTAETSCADDIDEDGDSTTDCNDSDCAADTACVDVNVDTSDAETDTNSAEGGGGCGCSFTANSPRGLRSLGYIVVLIVGIVALVARKRSQKK